MCSDMKLYRIWSDCKGFMAGKTQKDEKQMKTQQCG